MKKTLVALAVLAASGASFAQVTLTGNYTYGYRASTTGGATASDASGLGIDTSALTFTAVEDLGAGMSAKAVMSIDGLNRAGVGGGDSSLSLGGGFGTITLGTGRGSDYLSGGVSGVGGVGMDDKVFSRLDSADSISYKSPTFSGFNVSISHDENAIKRADESSGMDIGLGVGAAGTPASAAYQRGVNYSLSYAAGAIAANAAYKTWDQQGDSTIDNVKNRVSIAGSYNFGVAKVGAGYRSSNYVTGTRQDTFLAVGVPMGALTLGADYGVRKQDDRKFTAPDTVNGSRSGYGFKAEYALSKRTSVIGSYASWETSVNVANRSTETNLLLSHSF